MRISRRQLIGAGLGVVGTGALGACARSTPRSGFSLEQTSRGPVVTSGRQATARFAQPVKGGSLLVAVVARQSSSQLAPTIGQVADDAGNHWRQAVEFFAGENFGVDLWYCESANGGSTPLVTAIGLAYPPEPGIRAMRMALFEYAGATGFELCDQIGQAEITGDAVETNGKFPLRSDHELAISVIAGDMSAATTPAGWRRSLSDDRLGWFVADALDTGASSGRHVGARWTGLRGATTGAGVIATFVPKGVPATARRLVQSSYTDSDILPAGQGHPTWTSQPYPVDPKPGNTLVAFMNGSIYHPTIDCGSIVSLTDTAGGTWRKLGESGPDNHTGINISCWVCDSAVGGHTALLPTFSNDSQQLACLLLELANLPPDLGLRSINTRDFGPDGPPLTTPAPAAAGDVAFAFRTSIYIVPEGPGSNEWHQVMSDTTGANALMMLDTPPGPVAASWTGHYVSNGVDMMVVALGPGAG